MKFIAGLTSLLLSVFLFTGAALADGQRATSDLLDVLKAKGVLDQQSYDKLKKNETVSPTPASNTMQLLDVLRAKGVISEEDYSRLSKEAAPVSAAEKAAPTPAPEALKTAPAPVQTAIISPVSEAGQPVRPLNGALTDFEDGFARLTGNKVRLKISALLQAGWLYDDSGISVGSPPTGQISDTADNTFFVRRAKLFFGGKIFRKVGFKISLDGTTSPLLSDAYAYLDYIPYTRVTIGQFKTPFSVDQLMSIGAIPTINRSLVTNMIVNPQLRDVGGMLSGAYRMKGRPFGAGYATEIVNGKGKNNVDDNNRKDWAGRAWINPFVKGLTLGGSWYVGDTRAKSGDKNHDHQKWGADFEYAPTMVKGLRMMGEFEWERRYYDSYVSSDIFNTAKPNAFGRYAHTFGYYLEAWYRVNNLSGPASFLNGFEPVVRYDFLDEATSGVANDRDRWTFGANYYLNRYLRIMADWEVIHAESGLAANSLERIDLKSHNLFTTLLQIKF
ncbi:MAG: porin [Nitrospirota bacterium]